MGWTKIDAFFDKFKRMVHILDVCTLVKYQINYAKTGKQKNSAMQSLGKEEIAIK